jgi:hypothetical protein
MRQSDAAVILVHTVVARYFCSLMYLRDYRRNTAAMPHFTEYGLWYCCGSHTPFYTHSVMRVIPQQYHNNTACRDSIPTAALPFSNRALMKVRSVLTLQSPMNTVFPEIPYYLRIVRTYSALFKQIPKHYGRTTT